MTNAAGYLIQARLADHEFRDAYVLAEGIDLNV
jgi:hypothetical protein